MKEVVTAIDVNFSTNGSSHSATVSSSVVDDNCTSSVLGSIDGTIGRSSTFSEKTLHKFLDGFILSEETVTKDPIGIKKTRKYIDSLSMKLDSWILLVRGVTCSPTTSLKYYGNVYAASQLPAQAFGYVPNFSNAMGGATLAKDATISSSNRIIILGRTRTVISAFSPPSLTKTQSGNVLEKQRIYRVYEDGKLNQNLSIGPEFGIVFENAQVKYGYTASEFFKALQSLGINIIGAETLFSDDILFEQSGTLRSCLSAVTSFFGLYWYIDRVQNSWSIRIISSSYANQFKIEDPTIDTDSRILSASFSKGGKSPRNVCSYIGTTNSDDGSGGGSITYGRQASKAQLKLVDFSQLYGSTFSSYNIQVSLIQKFFTFFTGSIKGSSDAFDKLIYFCIHKYPSFSGQLGSSYTDIPEDKGEVKIAKNIFDEAGSEAKKDDLALVNLNFEDKFYSLQSTAFKQMEKPSNSKLYTVLNSFFTYYNSLYISHGYSEYRANNIGISNASGPYRSDDYISVIPDLSDFCQFLISCSVDIPTISKLAQYAGVRSGDYYFISLKTNSLPSEIDQESNWDGLNTRMALINGSADRLYLGFKADAESLISNQITASESAFQKAGNNLFKKKSYLMLPRIETEEQDSSSGDQQEKTPDFDVMYFDVKTPIANDFTKSDLKVFNGDTQEVRAIADAWQATFANSYDLNSSSVTYYDLIFPDLDITLDSVSISIGSDGATTTITRSNKSILPPDNSIFVNKYQAQNTHRDSYTMSAGQKNFFRFN